MAEGFEIGRAFIEVFTEDRTEEGTKSMGKSLLAWAGGIGVGAILTEQIMGGLDIEAGVDKMQAQLGIGADRAGELGKLAGDLYANNYGESMESVRDTITAVVSTVPGMSEASDEAIKDIAKSAENFQSAFGTPVEETVNSVSQLMTTGLATSGEDAMDLLTRSMQALPVALRGELGPIIDEYGTNFAALGFTGSQTMEMLTDAAAKGGIGMDKYGDAVKEFGIRATDMSTTSGAAYAAIGLDQKTMADAILAGGDTAKDATAQIRNGLLAITDPSAQAQAAIALFGTPLEDLGVNQIPQFLDGLGGVEGGLADVKGASEELDGTLNGNSKATFETFKRQAMMGLSNIVNGNVIPAIQAVVGWFIRFQTPITIVAGILLGVLVPAFVIAAAQATISAIKQVAAFVMAQAAAAVAAAQMVARVAVMVASWVLLGAQSLIQAARVAAAWLISMGPIALVIAAVVGLVVIIVANWETIKNAITGAVQFVIDWLSANWPLILAIITGPIGLIVLMIVSNWDTIKNATSAVKDWIVDAFNAVVGFLTGIPGAITGALGDLWGGVKNLTSDAKNWIVDRFNEIVDFFGGLGGRISNVASGMWDGLKSAFRSAVNFIIDGWNGLSFRIPGFHVGPVGYDGFSLSLPHINRLAAGGFIPAVPGGIMANIGEGRDDEIVSPVPMLERIVRDNSNGGGGLTNEDRALLRAVANRPVEVSVDGKALFTTMKVQTQREAQRR